MWGFGDLGDSLDGRSPVVGGGLVHRTNMNSLLLRRGWGLPNTLLGFETTGPLLLRPFGGTGSSRHCRPEGFGWWLQVIGVGVLWGPSSTLLGFETTGPLFPGHCVWWEACCCPRFWWWGVVFDSCIVVASINSRKVSHLSFVLGEYFVCVVVV